jgi:hypothetical protein
MNIQQYQGKRIKDGNVVRGYAARGTECQRAFIMVPVGPADVSIVEVEPDSLVPIM